MDEVKVLGSTDKGKELAIKIRKGTPLWEFCWKDGGKVPPELGGIWQESFARQAAKDYLSKKAQKVKTKEK